WRKPSRGGIARIPPARLYFAPVSPRQDGFALREGTRMAVAPAVPGPAPAPPASKRQRGPFRHARDLSEPQLSVVIVNYAQWESTAQSARQILRIAAGRYGAVEVVIVDNHSPPHPLIPRLRRWPGVSVRRWGRNRGFPWAATAGAGLSRGRWLLLRNPG